MAVKIRLTRVGRKKVPGYRVVVAEERSKRDGRVIETIGHYDPRKAGVGITLLRDRVEYWMGKGARPTLTVARLIKDAAKAVQPA